MFDYLYIKDLIPIIKFFLKNQKLSGDFNISTTESISLSQIVDLINKNSKKPSKIIVMNKKLNFQYTGSSNKLLKTIPSLKITSYKDSVVDFYNYFERNIETLDKAAIIQDNYLKISKTK